MEVASGSVADEPFARLLYRLAVNRFTGDVVLNQNGKAYRTSWEGGGVVAADSPSPADSAARTALQKGLVTSSLLSRALKEMQSSPDEPQIDVLARLARLYPAQVLDLKRELLLRRSSRMFAAATARYSVNNARSMTAEADVPALDVRYLIYQGVKAHYSVDRLKREAAPVLRMRFALAGDASESIRAFGFSETEASVLRALDGEGLSVYELDQSEPDLDTHAILSIVYALVACDCLAPKGPAPAEAIAAALVDPPSAPHSLANGTVRRNVDSVVPPIGGQGVREKRPTGRRNFRNSSVSAPVSPGTDRLKNPLNPGSRPPNRFRRASAGHRAQRETHSVVKRQRQPVETGRRRKIKFTKMDVETLIDDKLRIIGRDTNYFRLLGVSERAADMDIRTAYFDLAKKLHPDRIQALGMNHRQKDAQRVFATVNEAFGVLSSPRRLAEYKRILAAGGFEAVRKAEAAAEAKATSIFAAEEAFQKGQMALRRQDYPHAMEFFSEALELNPDEGEHVAMVAWTRWCATGDRAGVQDSVKSQLNKAARMSPNSVTIHYYRGVFSKQLGQLDAARKCFQTVVELNPNHRQAMLELRLLESRR